MGAAILAVLQALPQILQLITRLMDLAKERKLEAWLSDLETNVERAENAKTPEERRQVARGFVDLVRRIGT